MRARQWRRADHLFRDHDGGGVSRLRAHAGRYRAARSRARRAARRDQCDPPSGGDRDHPGLARPSGISRRHGRRDRRRKGRHPEARRAGGHRAAAGRGRSGHRGARRRSRRAALSLAARMALRAARRAACAMRASAGGSICRCRPCPARTRSPMPARRSPASSSCRSSRCRPRRHRRRACARSNGRRGCSA